MCTNGIHPLNTLVCHLNRDLSIFLLSVKFAMHLNIPSFRFSKIYFTYSEIRTFLKKQHTENTMYMSVTTSTNNIVHLSENHPLYARKNSSDKFNPMLVYYYI